MWQLQLLNFLNRILDNATQLCDMSISTRLGAITGGACGPWLLWIYKAWINDQLLSASMTRPLTIISPLSLQHTCYKVGSLCVGTTHPEPVSRDSVINSSPDFLTE